MKSEFLYHHPIVTYYSCPQLLAMVHVSATLWGFDIGCGQQQMALRIDQLLTPNHGAIGAFDLINVKSPICPGWEGGGGVALTTDRCITVLVP